jgi:hypothetical protein
MRCGKCGFENPEGMKFCGQCTNPLGKVDTAIATTEKTLQLLQASTIARIWCFERRVEIPFEWRSQKEALNIP